MISLLVIRGDDCDIMGANHAIRTTIADLVMARMGPVIDIDEHDIHIFASPDAHQLAEAFLKSKPSAHLEPTEPSFYPADIINDLIAVTDKTGALQQNKLIIVVSDQLAVTLIHRIFVGQYVKPEQLCRSILFKNLDFETAAPRFENAFLMSDIGQPFRLQQKPVPGGIPPRP